MHSSPDNPYQSTTNRIDRAQLNIPDLASVVRVNQIIVLALAAGLVTFLGFAIFQVMQRNQALNLSFGMLTLIGLGLLVAAIPVSFILPRLLPTVQATTSTATDRVEELKQRYTTHLIIGCAIVEGPSFLNIFAFMFEHNPLSVLAALIGIAMIAVRFPTKFGMQDWIAKRLADQ